ncbi:MAG: hypothetical protein AABZ60_17305, partial [Planctomycetota bacterium]
MPYLADRSLYYAGDQIFTNKYFKSTRQIQNNSYQMDLRFTWPCLQSASYIPLLSFLGNK